MRAESSPIQPEPAPTRNDRFESRAMLALLLCGLLLRLVVFLTASPFNPDNHLEVIQFIAQNGSLPESNLLSQSYHPPLYYVLMAGLWKVCPSERAVHFASLVFSSTNLLLIYRTLGRQSLIRSAHARLIVMAFACFLPQVVMFSSFISNDSLTLLVGTLIFLATLRYLRTSSAKSLCILAVCVGAGVLTKGTFLLTGPALAILVFIMESQKTRSRAFYATAGFCGIFILLGCYKYIENYSHFGTFIVHNLDRGGEVFATNQHVWRGPATIFDINVLKLIERPILQIHNAFSYPLLMYATFWYPHIPDSSFVASIHGYSWTGSTIYACAVVPTLIFIYGFIRGCIAGAIKPIENRIALAAGLLLVSNLAVVLAAGFRYDVWWCFQSRLCFQSILPAMVFFGIGADALPKSPLLRQIIYAICWLTVGCCLLYFAVEIAYARGLLPAGTPLQP